MSGPVPRFNAKDPPEPGGIDHTAFVRRVRDLVLADAERRGTVTSDEAAVLRRAVLVYGVGDGSYRGRTYYASWRAGDNTAVDTVEITATGEESWVQLAGTTIHELAHVLAGHDAGHGPDWKHAGVRLGFARRPQAAGQVYTLALFEQVLVEQVQALADELGDGHPAFLVTGAAVPRQPRPCSAGTGARGGRSRGKGSGSRMAKAVCGCEPQRIIRASTAVLAGPAITCEACRTAFHPPEP